MRVRESGMPDRSLWETFFDPPLILDRLGLDRNCRDVLEFGCGYGTFTLPAAARIRGILIALDIDPAMLAAARARAGSAGVTNVEFRERDFVEDGSGLADAAVDYAMLFNILHLEDPVALLREAARNVRADGRLGIIHWNYDPSTPRGPPLAIRPRPAEICEWAECAELECGPAIDLPPYHYGFVLSRRA